MEELRSINYEGCEICGEPTGKAGKGEDSLYAEWAITPQPCQAENKAQKQGHFAQPVMTAYILLV